MKINWRTSLAFAHDLLACAIVWLIAFYLRFNFEVPSSFQETALKSMLWVTVVHAPIFVAFNLYNGIWRFASIHDLQRIIGAVFVAALVSPAVMLMLKFEVHTVPRAVFFIAPVFLIMAMGGSRFAYRAWKERNPNGKSQHDHTPVLIVGDEDAAVRLIKELVNSSQWRVVGVLAQDRSKHGRELHGVKILGAFAEIAAISSMVGAKHAIVAMPEAPQPTRREAIELARAAGLQVLTVPTLDDLISGKVTVSQIRNVELDDLLGRDPVVLDTEGLKGWISNNVVFVSGAGGSIGSELCRQVALYQPRLLILFEQNEFALYRVEQEFSALNPDLNIACVIGDVKNSTRVRELFEHYRPSVVFHAAAYKHVPLMETNNAWEAVDNNVKGTLVLAKASIASGVGKFVLISTDKAVNPTNVMGASKRLAEKVCQCLHQLGNTRFVMVRFGNVLGSAGSVIPKFREQISDGGPVTVTHPEITRYFMSIPEAVQLVLQAGLMGQGGEIFVLDMGEPVRITDLAKALIRLSGYSESEIRIVYTGLRPGEKLYEEPLAEGENILPTPHPKLHIAQAQCENAAWLEDLAGWLASNTVTNTAAVKAELARRVPEYTPQHMNDA